VTAYIIGPDDSRGRDLRHPRFEMAPRATAFVSGAAKLRIAPASTFGVPLTRGRLARPQPRKPSNSSRKRSTALKNARLRRSALTRRKDVSAAAETRGRC